MQTPPSSTSRYIQNIIFEITEPKIANTTDFLCDLALKFQRLSLQLENRDQVAWAFMQKLCMQGVLDSGLAERFIHANSISAMHKLELVQA